MVKHKILWLAAALLAGRAMPGKAAERSVVEAPFRARADMKMLSEVAIEGGSKRLTSASAAFAKSDVGKAVVIASVADTGIVLSTTVAAVTDSKNAVLATAAPKSVSRAQVAYGTNNTVAFQSALDAVREAKGGVVNVPSGAYLLLGTLTIPRFVILHGDSMLPSSLIGALPGNQFPGEGPLDGGTTLGMVAGFGNARAQPQITINTNAALEGVAIYNPLQSNAENLSAPTPSPWAIDLVGNADRVSNVNLVNVYQGIRMWKGVRHWVDHISGQPTFKGLSIDNGGDVNHIEAIHFVPQFNNNSSLTGPGKNGIWQWQQQHGTAFEIGRDDQFRMIDLFCLGYYRGFHFAVNPSNTPNARNLAYGRLIGCGADLTAQAVYVDNVEIVGITFTDCDFIGLNDSPDNASVYTAPTFTGRLSFVNCNFWYSYGSAVIINAAPYTAPNVSSPEVTFTSCQFQTWGISEQKNACIRAYGGSVRVMGCDFRLEDRPIFFAGPDVRQFLATNNFCAGGVKLQVGSAPITQANNLKL